MADYPDCEPCIWRVDESGNCTWSQFARFDGENWVSPVSDELNARIGRWVLDWVEHIEDNDSLDWLNDEIHDRWLHERWVLLRDINSELLPTGFIVRAGKDFMSPPEETYGSAELSDGDANSLTEDLNQELRRRALPAL